MPVPFSAYAYLEGDTLVLGNTLIEHTWRVSGPHLVPIRITDRRSGLEWLASPASLDTAAGLATLEQHWNETGVGEPALLATLRVAPPEENGSLVYHFRVPCTAVALSFSVERVEEEGGNAGALAEDSLFLSRLPLAPLHLKLVQVELRDQTDAHNELAFEREWLLHPSERLLSLAGNLFWVEDFLSGQGLIVLKEAPLPHVRPVSADYDLCVTGKQEITLATLPGQGMAGDWTTLLCYEGGVFGRIQALQAYQRSLRGCDPARDGLFLSNTWGDRGQDGRLSEAFLVREIAAAAALGVDVVQLDDGWQAGRTSNSVVVGGRWEGFWGETNFWTPDPVRFPGGLAPVTQAARAAGLQIGLWYAPDSADDFAHWREDAETILALQRTHQINHFKMDGIKIRSARGAEAVRRLFQTLLRESHGQIACDLDVTDETRPGYFGAMNVGPLFVENRYTDWHGYWPHQTLRNVWKLSHYLDPLRLRIEVLNNERNTELYENDPLAPACYEPAYLFAVACFASPLGWFETSGLSAAYVSALAPFVTVWKAHRDNIRQGTILPIGETPDGTSWTGFLSVNGDSHYLLAFRELNTTPRFSFSGLPIAGQYQAEVLYGSGSVEAAGGVVTVELQQAQSFVLARLSKVSGVPE